MSKKVEQQRRPQRYGDDENDIDTCTKAEVIVSGGGGGRSDRTDRGVGYGGGRNRRHSRSRSPRRDHPKSNHHNHQHSTGSRYDRHRHDDDADQSRHSRHDDRRGPRHQQQHSEDRPLSRPSSSAPPPPPVQQRVIPARCGEVDTNDDDDRNHRRRGGGDDDATLSKFNPFKGPPMARGERRPPSSSSFGGGASDGGSGGNRGGGLLPRPEHADSYTTAADSAVSVEALLSAIAPSSSDGSSGCGVLSTAGAGVLGSHSAAANNELDNNTTGISTAATTSAAQLHEIQQLLRSQVGWQDTSCEDNKTTQAAAMNLEEADVPQPQSGGRQQQQRHQQRGDNARHNNHNHNHGGGRGGHRSRGNDDDNDNVIGFGDEEANLRAEQAAREQERLRGPTTLYDDASFTDRRHGGGGGGGKRTRNNGGGGGGGGAAHNEAQQALLLQQRSAAARALERAQKVVLAPPPAPIRTHRGGGNAADATPAPLRVRPLDRLLLLFNLYFQDPKGPSHGVIADAALRALTTDAMVGSPPAPIPPTTAEDDGLLVDGLLECLDVQRQSQQQQASAAADAAVEGGTAAAATVTLPPPEPGLASAGSTAAAARARKAVGAMVAAVCSDAARTAPPHAGLFDYRDPAALALFAVPDADVPELLRELDDMVMAHKAAQQAGAQDTAAAALEDIDCFWGLVADVVQAAATERAVRAALRTATEGPAASSSTKKGGGARQAGGPPPRHKKRPLRQVIGMGPMRPNQQQRGGGGFGSDASDDSDGPETKLGGDRDDDFYDGASAGPFYGAAEYAAEASAMVNAVPHKQLPELQRELQFLSDAPRAATATTTTAATGVDGGDTMDTGVSAQARYLYHVALARCTLRLAVYYLRVYTRNYCRSQVPPPITPYARQEAELLKERIAKLASTRGLPPALAALLAADGITSKGGLLPAPEAAGAGGVEEIDEVLVHGLGVDHVPTEADLAAVMRRYGDDGEALLDGAGGGGGGVLDEDEDLMVREEIHDYYRKALTGGGGGTGGAAGGDPSGHLLPTPANPHEQLLAERRRQLDPSRPLLIKPIRFAKVKTGYVWHAYNRAKYSLRNGDKPPKVVLWYEFTLFYPLIVNAKKDIASMFRVEHTEKGETDDHCVLVFCPGPPYADVAYRIVNEQWDRRRGGVRVSFDDRGRFRLYFRLASNNYRR